MTALQNIMSKLGLGEAGKASAANDRRSRPDRRTSEARDNVFLLHGTESRLQFAARAVGFGTYDLDSSTGDIHCSPELKAIAGLPPDDTPLALEQIRELIRPDERERFMARFGASLDPHRRLPEFEDECCLLRPDGALRRVKVKGRALFMGHGNTRQLLGATGIVVDITAAQAAEQRLEQQAELLDLVPDPILAWDQRNGIVFWNKACERAYGYSRDEAIGQPCHELLRPDFPTSRQACLAELARSGEWSGKVCYTARDGRKIAVESRMQRVKHDGRVTVLEADRPIGELDDTPPPTRTDGHRPR